MRKPLIAGNWKMHGSRAMVTELLQVIKEQVNQNQQADIAVFPPFVYLEQVKQLLQTTQMQWGAQNMAVEKQGAYTGEISGEMLQEFGCHYVLIGHSERRTLYGETNEVLAQKFAAAKKIGLQPILCLGETLAQREQGLTQQIIEEQLDAVLLSLGAEAFENALLAYEPVWAIGTGLTASPEQAQAVHAMLRQKVAGKSQKVASELRILYGGSVKPAGAKALFEMPDIDGGLIGGAALIAKDFLDIYCSVN